MKNTQEFKLCFVDDDVESILKSPSVDLSKLLLACYVVADIDGNMVNALITADSDSMCVHGAECVVWLKYQPNDNLIEALDADSLDALTIDRLLEIVENCTAFVPDIANHFWSKAEQGAIEVNGEFIRYVNPMMSLEEAAFADANDDFLVICDNDGEIDYTITVNDALLVRPISDNDLMKIGKEPVVWTLSDMATDLFSLHKAV